MNIGPDEARGARPKASRREAELNEAMRADFLEPMQTKRLPARHDRSRADRAAQRAEERKETLSVRLEQSQGAEITARFRQIMDGYENRIEDLMRELLGCREEIKDLRQAFDKHKDRCRGCPYVSGLEAADGTA